ncbi:beta-hexosaminidase [Marinosulfonomonas sp. PRT-SC04]|nr:beta-hexosaminidase [Marinosulfonomonas sp. PRT-SC04]
MVLGPDLSQEPRQGAYLFGCAGEHLSADETAFFAATNPWGFILFARNINNPEQLRRLTADLRRAVGRDAVITIDQEGGRVERMTPPHWRHWLPPLDQVARNPEAASRSMYLRSRIIADELRRVGIDSNCSPCADVANAQTHPFLRNRCYGEDAQTVATVARAVADGLLDGGVLPVLKHMPGHGRGTLDSHKQLPRVAAKRADLEAVDFAAMRALNDLPLGMSAHIVYEDIDPDQPATTSLIMSKLIRNQIGFSGLLMTDDLSMQALTGDLRSRTQAALAAGMDMILHCNGEISEMDVIAEQAGEFTDVAQMRADSALKRRVPADNIDISTLEAELASLINGRENE